MTPAALKLFIHSLILEAKDKQKETKQKEETKLPKSSGKLIDLKKELAALKQMKSELEAAKFAEKTASTEVEFASLSKFAAELDKIKASGVALEQRMETKIQELEDKVTAEKNKVREMIGMTPKAGQEKMVDEKKEQLPPAPSDEETAANQVTEVEEKQFKVGDKITFQYKGQTVGGKITQIVGLNAKVYSEYLPTKETSIPFSKLTKASIEEARFKKGTDIGKKGKGFEKIEKTAAKQYGSKEAGKKVAGAILKKVIKK
jgi:hypothetical protein